MAPVCNARPMRIAPTPCDLFAEPTIRACNASTTRNALRPRRATRGRAPAPVVAVETAAECHPCPIRAGGRLTLEVAPPTPDPVRLTREAAPADRYPT